jgi:SAM-dependent methyltransferase
MQNSIIIKDSGISGYAFDRSTGIHARPGASGIGYRDGGEYKLEKIAGEVQDRSTFSNEFVQHMNDWPSEYHFSRKRHLVLRPFSIKKGDRVLELGSGCGSITRYLAEIGAEVTTVEGEEARARVAVKRCEGFPNVRFIVDNFLSLDLKEKFDWVLMIGVLEYSQKYAKSSDRQHEYLDIARKHLAADGTLVIAIENKIGIKYLNGAGEDHNGKRYYGPQDLYRDDDITTWGKAEIREKISNAGFKNIKFFAAFPDYKLPKVIFSEDIDKNRHFRAEELLHYVKSLDYRGKNERVFDESLVLGSFRKNGIMTEVANSFVIACSVENLDHPYDQNLLAHYFSVDRKKELCTETRFLIGAENRVTVIKNSFEKENTPHSQFITVKSTDGELIKIMQYEDKSVSQYFDGELLGFGMTKATKRGDVENLKMLLRIWGAFLTHTFKIYCRYTGALLTPDDLDGRKLKSVCIEGIALDCGPHNIVRGDQITAFDLEWHSDRNIPLGWVLYRNAKTSARLRHSSIDNLSVNDIVSYIADRLGLVATDFDIDEAIQLENQFQASVALVEPSGKKQLTNALDIK